MIDFQWIRKIFTSKLNYDIIKYVLIPYIYTYEYFMDEKLWLWKKYTRLAGKLYGLYEEYYDISNGGALFIKCFYYADMKHGLYKEWYNEKDGENLKIQYTYMHDIRYEIFEKWYSAKLGGYLKQKI